MVRRPSLRSVFALIGSCALLGACATGPAVRYTEPPPGLQLGPVLELLSVETEGDPLDALIDNEGNAHVFIAAQGLAEVHHLVVSPEGVVQDERVASNTAPSTISAAYGSDGRLHVLLDARHLVQDETGWRAAGPTPWRAADIGVHRPHFVRATGGYLWAFEVPGKEVGAKGRWEWYAIGGAGGALILPWYSSSRKLVFVPEAATGEPLWYVVDPQDNLDTAGAESAVDDQGNLHVVYTASREGIAASYLARYARIALVPPTSATAGPTPADASGPGKLVPLHGSPIPWTDQAPRALLPVAAAVDPARGTLMIVKAHGSSLTREDGNWHYPATFPLSAFWEPKLVPAGGNAFHLMTMVDDRVLYLHYSARQWSVPVELGEARVASGSVWSTLGIASHASRRAFVVWPTKTSVVGRWLEAPAAVETPVVEAPRAQPPGAAPIPEALRDFAAGRAELVTPGVVTGFPEAWASAEHGTLTRSLHDASQWEALATVVLEDDYGDDLHWYYLGRAAEGMGLCDAAERYYRTSEQRSQSFWTRCLGIACFGLEFPTALGERLAAVEAMRAAGQCRDPPR